MDSILHIRPEHTVFTGDFGFTSQHRHGALVLLIGLSGTFNIQLPGQDSVPCRSALIDPNVDHTVDCRSEHLAVMYFDILSHQGRALRQTFLAKHPAAFDIVNDSIFNKQIERRILNADLESLLINTLDTPKALMDNRIATCMKLMHSLPNTSYSQSDLGQQMGLSNSRLNHLFKLNTGLTFRHYKLWSKLSFFMRDFHTTGNLTDSALNSGFSDASHLSNSHRKIFGVTPSMVLGNLDEFRVFA